MPFTPVGFARIYYSRRAVRHPRSGCQFWEFHSQQTGISNSCSFGTCERREAVRVAAVVSDVEHGPAAYDERIGEQLAVALPMDRFGAHEGDSLRAGESFHFACSFFEFCSQHEIRVSAKCRNAPGAIGRIRRGFTVAAQILAP